MNVNIRFNKVRCGRIISTIIILVLIFKSFSAPGNIRDSLLRAIDVEMNDSMRLALKNDLARYLIQRDRKQSKKLVMEVINEADLKKVKVQYAKAFCTLGYINYAEGRTDSAIALLKKSKDILENSNAKNELAVAYNYLCIAHAEVNFDTSVMYGVKAIEMQKQLPDQKMMSQFYHNLGYIYASHDRYNQALELYHKCLSNDSVFNDSANMAVTLLNIGEVCNYMGNYTKSVSNYIRALTIFELKGFKMGEAKALHNLGAIYAVRKQYDKSLNYLNRSLAIKRKIDDKKGEANSLLTIGEVYSFQELYDSAKTYYNQAYSIFTKINNSTGLSAVYKALGDLYMNSESFDSASVNYRAMLDISKKIGELCGESYCYLKLGEIDYRQNKLQSSLALTKKSLQ
ncbi:MAG: tetratricopeptide repeat protein, partial [Bacteroidales bacterium]|nr:tetratricopeptide repeat protein [Bacteroidales bacterium]